MNTEKSFGSFGTMASLDYIGGRPIAQNQKRRPPYSELKALLIRYRFLPGEQLQVAGLAKLLNTSTTPVREALSRLHAEGFLVLQPHRGFFAKALSVREMTELYEFGYLLLRRAIEKSIDTSGVTVSTALDVLIEDVARITHSDESDLDFCATQIEQVIHKLVSFAQNDVMYSVFRNYLERTHYARVIYLQEPKQVQKYVHDLQALIGKMKKRDLAAAIAVVDKRWNWKLQLLPDLVKDANSRHYT